MNRRPPLQHPLAALFQRAAQSLTASLNQETIRFYHCTIRNFLNFLGAQYPQAHSLQQPGECGDHDGGDLDRVQAVERHRGRARLRRRPGHTEPERGCGRQDPYVTENPVGVPADNLSLRACGLPRARKTGLRTGKTGASKSAGP